jgi:hypothetical protein
VCLEGARAVAQLLDQHPAARIRVFVIWTPRLLPDARDQWDPEVLDDPRVTHTWDEPTTVARDMARHAAGYQGPDWDYWLLFGPDASWTGDGPGPLLASGAPVIDRFDELTERLRPWL